MNILNKIINKTATLAFLIGGGLVPAAQKEDLTQQELPGTDYVTAASHISYTENFNFGAVTYHVQAYDYASPFLGLAGVEYDVTIYWNDNGPCGYAVSDKKFSELYSSYWLGVQAKKHNVPVWLTEARTKAHEKQHIKDHKKFDLLNFKGFNNLETDKSSVEKRRAEISDRMEARAMAAGLEGMKKAIKKHINGVNKEIKNIKKSAKEQHSQEQRIAELNKKLEEYQDLLQNAESLMLKMYGTTPIMASGTKYVDAYKIYIKQGDMLKDKKFAAFIYSQTPVLEAYFAECVKELRAKKSTSGYTESILLRGRPVCRPCMWGDLLGKCKHCWCPNHGNVPSKYEKRKGDYIPDNYKTLEQKK